MQLNINSVRSQHSTFEQNVVKMFPKLPNKYPINLFVKYFEHIQAD